MLMTGDSTSRHFLQPPPGNPERKVNKGPQQQNHETDKNATNQHSHVINTQSYQVALHHIH